jgi:hypothetical protein
MKKSGLRDIIDRERLQNHTDLSIGTALIFSFISDTTRYVCRHRHGSI